MRYLHTTNRKAIRHLVPVPCRTIPRIHKLSTATVAHFSALRPEISSLLNPYESGKFPQYNFSWENYGISFSQPF